MPDLPSSAAPVETPTVCSVRRDTVCREVRLELADWRTRTGGVYDLAPAEQEALLLPGHLPSWEDFLPDFVIVYAKGDPATVEGADGAPVETVVWRDLHVHAGGVQRTALSDPRVRRELSSTASAEWRGVDALLGHRPRQAGAPTWLLSLIRERTPWGALLEQPVDAPGSR